MALVFLFLYAPILLLVVFSFNAGGSNVVWEGFSLRWYQELFQDRRMMEAVYTTLLVSVLATLISTVAGTFASVGLYGMKKRWREPILSVNNIPIMNGDYIYIPSLETGKITVLGEVYRQNCIPFQPDLTLLQAIGISGGLKETNSSDIKVIRGGLKSPVVYNVNIKAMQLGRIRDFALRPKDIVFVPRDPISEWNVIMRLILPTVQVLNGLAGPFGNPASTFYD